MKISAIAVIAKNRALGKDGGLLFHVPGDLPRFKKITSGHPIIMGRRTFESKEIRKRPLPGRMNIVVTRDPNYAAEGVEVCGSLNEALGRAKEGELEIPNQVRDDKKVSENDKGGEIFVIGGGQIYREAWPFIDKLYLTVVDEEMQGDVFFPDYSDFGRVILKEDHEADGMRYSFIELEK